MARRSLTNSYVSRRQSNFSDRKSTRLNSSHMSISYAVFCLTRRPPTPTLFPYTTLFRSVEEEPLAPLRELAELVLPLRHPFVDVAAALDQLAVARAAGEEVDGQAVADELVRLAAPVELLRSEEHTSELQSHVNLVCRLLLDPPPTDTYTLSLHDALPICRGGTARAAARTRGARPPTPPPIRRRRRRSRPARGSARCRRGGRWPGGR